MLIAIHPSAIEDQSYRVAYIDLLEFLGYDVMVMNSMNFFQNVKYAIDARVPEWRGWRLAMAEITVLHRDKMIEWEQQKEERKVIACALPDDIDDCPS